MKKPLTFVNKKEAMEAFKKLLKEKVNMDTVVRAIFPLILSDETGGCCRMCHPLPRGRRP